MSACVCSHMRAHTHTHTHTHTMHAQRHKDLGKNSSPVAETGQFSVTECIFHIDLQDILTNKLLRNMYKRHKKIRYHK